MTPERLQQLIESYGAEVDRWPRSERDAARTLLERTPDAQAQLRLERDLDVVLDRWPAPDPSALLARRIARQAGTVAQMRRPDAIGARRLLPQVAAMAAAAALGFFIGMNGIVLAEQPDNIDVGGLVLGSAALEAWQ